MVADISRFQQILTSAKSALIVLPDNPSTDEVASGLALMLSLKASNFPVAVSCPSPMTVEFSRLVGVNQVRADAGDKNMVISFAEYPAENIERVSYNIENNVFALTIIPKPGFDTPTQNQITASYAGVASDLVIIIGANYPNDLGAFSQTLIKDILEGQARQNLTLVGNKPLVGWPKSVELIDVKSTSTSEVVYQIIDQLKLPQNQDISTNLFLGLEAGSKNFTVAGVGANTFALAAKLLENGAKRGQIIEQTFKSNQRSRQVDQQNNPQNLEPKFKDTTIL